MFLGGGYEIVLFLTGGVFLVVGGVFCVEGPE